MKVYGRALGVTHRALADGREHHTLGNEREPRRVAVHSRSTARRRPTIERDSLSQVLDLVRSGAAGTRQEIELLSGLGRATVADRLASLIRLGLVEEGELGASTGGRAPRQIQFRAAAGHVLVAAVGTTTLGVGLTDLAGRLLVEHHESGDVTAGPEPTMERLDALFQWILGEHASRREIWGIGLALPGPVEHAGGQLGSAPLVHMMPGWDDFPIRRNLWETYQVPAWIDAEVHFAALGELRAGRGRPGRDLLFLKLGSEISVGLCADGRVLRGAQGFAGDIGHVAVDEAGDILCRCGNVGCLAAVAGGAAIAREAKIGAEHDQSPYLTELLKAKGKITAADVGMAARRGDRFSIELLTRSGQLVGATLATLVNAYNPSLVVVGGGVAHAGEIVISAIRESVYRHSRSLATQDLQIVRSELGKTGGLVGAALAAADELFAIQRFREWVDHGSPVAAERESSTMRDG